MNEVDKLKAPFPANKISWRVGATTKTKDKGIALAYIDARDAMQRLDEVCGSGAWQCRYPWSDSGRIVCEVGINIGHGAGGLPEWIWKANGAGSTQVEADKGAFSDAFKRACVLWGIGQYLYDLPNTWMPLNEKKAFSKETKKELTIRLSQWQESYFKTEDADSFEDNEQEIIYGGPLDIGNSNKPVDELKPTVDLVALKALLPTATAILLAIENNDTSTLLEAWNELTREEMELIWTAKTKGGYFTQEHKDDIRSVINLAKGE